MELASLEVETWNKGQAANGKWMSLQGAPRVGEEPGGDTQGTSGKEQVAKREANSLDNHPSQVLKHIFFVD